MSLEHVTSLQSFQNIIATSEPRLVVVDFHASWCGPCRAIAPHYQALAQRYGNRVRFLKVDVDQAQEIARFSQVSAMPTFHFYRRASRVASFSGADPSQLDRTVETHAPTSSQLSFAGAGQRLASNQTSSSNHTSSASPSSSSASASASASASSAAAAMRDAAARAAARRLQTPTDPASAASSASKPPDSSANPSPDNDAPNNDARLTVSPIFLKQMVHEMGFPKIRAEKALILTSNKSLEAAVDWCFEHADDPDIDQPLQVVTSLTDPSPKQSLSPEDAKARADALFLKARAKRLAEEKRDAADREKARIKSGKDIANSKTRLEDEARHRAVEERRRQKREEQAQRQRVRQMLEADKQARRLKFNMPNAPASNNHSTTTPKPQSQPILPAPSAARPPSASASHGVIQFRLPDGSKLEGTFSAEQTLADILSFLKNSKPDLSSRRLQLSQQYPRKVYSQDDFSTPLHDLNLLPRGALNVSFS